MTATVVQTMQAAVLHGHGGLEQIEVTDDYPVPAPARDEVLVRVGAAGMNNTDLWTRQGAYAPAGSAPRGWRGKPLSLPRVQGGDVAGRIVATGSGVADERVGERVLVNGLLYASAGDPLLDAGLLGSERDGGFAEYVAVPAANALAIDSDYSDAELATFPIAALTALHMLNRARLSAGEDILVTGASGGVGSALVQLAAARGARVTALTGPGKQAFAESLGAHGVVERTGANVNERIRAAGHFDVVADVVGGSMFTPFLEALRRGGRLVTAGAIAGPDVDLDLRTVYLRHLELIGSTMGTQAEFAELVELIGKGRLRPALAQTYPLSAIHRAQRDFEGKRFTGNLVLVPDAMLQNSAGE